MSQKPCDGIISVPFDLRSKAGNYRRSELGREEQSEQGRARGRWLGGRRVGIASAGAALLGNLCVVVGKGI